MYAEALTQMPKTNPVYTDEEEQKKKGTGGGGGNQFEEVAKAAANFVNAGNTNEVNSLLTAAKAEGKITEEQRKYLNHLKNIYV